jgi:hypothetical protein
MKIANLIANMKELLKKGKFLVKEYTFILPEVYIWVKYQIMEGKDKEYFTIAMKIYMLASGKIMNKMEKENFILFKMEI